VTSVTPVSDRHGFLDFVRVPHRVYARDPNWVPPLTLERKLHYSHRNPYFEHAQAQYFIAYRNGRAVGRVSAQIDNLAQPGDEATVGHFGCLEAVDADAMAALVEAAEMWLVDRGITEVLGPFSLSINDEVGMLIQGFDRPARMLMNYAPSWYGEAIESLGYRKAKDLLAYRIDVAAPLPNAARRLADHADGTEGISERPMDPSRFREELRTVVDVFNDAWAENWGFVPMTAAEAGQLADNLKPLIHAELIRFVERDGKPVAIIVGLPDLHEAIADLNGRLLPFGWARLAYRLKANKVRGGRILLMGVRKAHRTGFMGSAIASLLVTRLHAAAREVGIRELELSWVLEDNEPTNRMITSLGGELYKRYRIYRKALA
jgi:hypothetical protein